MVWWVSVSTCLNVKVTAEQFVTDGVLCTPSVMHGNFVVVELFIFKGSSVPI